MLTKREVVAVLGRLSGIHSLLARLLYGTGMRLMEGIRLRVKDVDFERGNKDRITMLPASLADELKTHLAQVKTLHENDLDQGFGAVYLPFALARKYPDAGREWGWQYVFP